MIYKELQLLEAFSDLFIIIGKHMETVINELSKNCVDSCISCSSSSKSCCLCSFQRRSGTLPLPWCGYADDFFYQKDWFTSSFFQKTIMLALLPLFSLLSPIHYFSLPPPPLSLPPLNTTSLFSQTTPPTQEYPQDAETASSRDAVATYPAPAARCPSLCNRRL